MTDVMLHVIRNDAIIYLDDIDDLKEYANLLIFDRNDNVIGYINKDGYILADKNDEGCSFCNEGRNMLEPTDNEISVYNGSKLYVEYKYDEHDNEVDICNIIEISYCPMCGKQLRE